MLKKIWEKICLFYRSLWTFYEVIGIYVEYSIMFFGLSPIVGFFLVLIFSLIAFAPIYGLMWLYNWLCSLF